MSRHAPAYNFCPLYTCKHSCLQTHCVCSLTGLALTYTKTDPRSLDTRAPPLPLPSVLPHANLL